MTTKPRKQKQPVSWNLGINLISSSIQLKSEIARDFAAAQYGTETATTGKTGSGFMKYEGNFYHDNAVFIGTCDILKASKISFFGAEGLNQLKGFLTAYNGIEDTALRDDFDFSSTEFLYFCAPFSNTLQLRDLITALETTVQLQQSNRPVVTCAKGALAIGSKSSSNCRSVVISAYSPNAVTLDGNMTRVKVAGIGAKALWATLTTNVSLNIESCLASFMMDLLGKVTLSPILNDIRNDISKNYTVGKVFKPTPVSKSGVRSSTPSGAYVLKSLCGIKNKLNEVSTSNETQTLLGQWLSMILNDTTLINHGALVKELQEALGKKDPPKAAAKGGKAKATPIEGASVAQ